MKKKKIMSVTATPINPPRQVSVIVRTTTTTPRRTLLTPQAASPMKPVAVISPSCEQYMKRNIEATIAAVLP